MATYAARKVSYLWLSIPALFLIFAAGFIVTGKEIGASLALAGFMALLIYIFVRMKGIQSYTVNAEGISADGTEKRIRLKEIVDVHLVSPRRYMFGVFEYEGEKYGMNMTMASNPASWSLFVPPAMPHVFTTNKNNSFKVRNCFVLTPEDVEGFGKELRERLNKMKNSASP